MSFFFANFVNVKHRHKLKEYSTEFERRCAAFVAAQGLLHNRAPVLVALSGGADSVALLAVLTAMGYDCVAAHCNYHLRGDESMRDMRHACSVCDALGCDVYVRDFNVDERRAATGESVEMACREMRYAWFADLLDRSGAQAVAVGHHREDRVETFMLNLLRGTGLAGLTSMKPRHGDVVRPLLPFSRTEIEQYVALRGLSYVDDSSNASDIHRRNRLRNSILPLMERHFPGAADAILSTIENLEAAEDVYRQAIEAKACTYTTPQGIDLQALGSESQAATILFEMLRNKGFTASQAADMLAGADTSGQRFFSTDGSTVAEQNRGMLTFVDASSLAAAGASFDVNPRHDISSPVRIEVSFGPVELFKPLAGRPDVTFFDAAALDGEHRWELRHPRRGDRMVPFGSKKSKLLSDIFNNAKLTAQQKRDAWVMLCDGEIVWLPGLRNSALLSVGPGTKRFVRMQLHLSSPAHVKGNNKRPEIGADNV